MEIDSLRFWWNLHKMCLLVQKVKNRYQTCDFSTWLPWKRVMWFWPFLCYLDMKNSQNMHTLYIKYILFCWTRSKKSLHFFHVMTLASRCNRIVLLSCIHVPINRRMNMAYFSNLTKIGNYVILNIFRAQ